MRAHHRVSQIEGHINTLARDQNNALVTDPKTQMLESRLKNSAPAEDEERI